MVSKNSLENLYLKSKKSSAEISSIFKCSENKVNYWLAKYGIKKRSISEAVYLKNNPRGDPFKIKKPKNMQEAELRGLGFGLYWGEGTKANKNTIRLGNTDPNLISKFLEFMIKIYGVKKRDFKFGLQIFSDMNPKEALRFWTRYLGVGADQFQKVVVTPARSLGTYRNKTRHGVLTVNYNNKNLRDELGRGLKKFGFVE